MSSDLHLNVSNPELPTSVKKKTNSGFIPAPTGSSAYVSEDEGTPIKYGTAVYDDGADLNGDDEQLVGSDDERPTSGCAEFWAVWKYVFILIAAQTLMGIAGIVLTPILPGIKRRYFGSDKDAAFYTTVLQAVSSAIGLVLCPITGYAMDYFGRRPFFLIATCLNILPPVMLLVFYPNPWPFMIALSVSSLISASYASTYIADHYTSDKRRMMAFAFVTGSGSLPTALAIVVTVIPDMGCIITSCVFAVLAVIFCFFFIKESLPAEKLRGGTLVLPTGGALAAAETGNKFNWRDVENPFKAMKSVMNSKITIATVVIMGAFTVSQNGVGEIYFYYLNERVGFDKSDNAYVLLEAGTTWPFVLFVIVPFCKKVLKLHSITLVLFSVCCLAAELTVICTISAKWQLFAFGLPMSALVNMSVPALTTVIADGSTGEDQGRRQAGLAAIGDFFKTLAPLFFGLIYSHTDASLSFLPFAIAAVLTIPTFILTLKLRHWLVVLGQRNRSRSNSVAPTPRAGKLAYEEVPVDDEGVADQDVVPEQVASSRSVAVDIDTASSSASSPLLQSSSSHKSDCPTYGC